MPKQPRLGASEPLTPADDARHPDTNADRVEPIDSSDVTPDALEPDTYGFRNIDTEGAAEAYRDGPGTVDPVQMPALNSEENSTFAQRAAARRGTTTKVVGNTSSDVSTK